MSRRRSTKNVKGAASDETQPNSSVPFDRRDKLGWSQRFNEIFGRAAEDRTVSVVITAIDGRDENHREPRLSGAHLSTHFKSGSIRQLDIAQNHVRAGLRDRHERVAHRFNAHNAVTGAGENLRAKMLNGGIVLNLQDEELPLVSRSFRHARRKTDHTKLPNRRCDLACVYSPLFTITRYATKM